jgi:cell cycle checkpoint protein
LRIDEEGLLSLQFLMPSPKPKGDASDAFIEFRVRLLLFQVVLKADD